MPDKPVEIESIQAAAKLLVRHIDESPARHRTVIAIGGAVGSGKSTLASMIGGSAISTDDYLPDYAKTPMHMRDEPESSDLQGLAADLRLLKEHGSAEIPRWCFQEHRRIGTQSISADRVVVCEGIFALHPLITPSVDIRVLITADQSIRWSRWETIEQSGERGWGVEKAREHFHEIAEPTFQKHVQHYTTGLDYIVRNSV